MTGESANDQKRLLATANTEGTGGDKWASSDDVPERTAYRWALVAGRADRPQGAFRHRPPRGSTEHRANPD
jgi:hypothetical protein